MHTAGMPWLPAHPLHALYVFFGLDAYTATDTE